MTRGGVSLAVRHWPSVGAPWATMVLVHGLAEHSGRYEHVGAAFAAAGIDASAVDLRGCGASSGRRAYLESWDDYLGDVGGQVDAVRSAGLPLVLFGHSLGALVALSYVLSGRPAPDLLVLSAPAIGADVQLWRRVAASVLGRLAPTFEAPNGLRGDQLSRDPRVGEAYFADPLVHPRSTARLGHEIFSAMDRARSSVGDLNIPTLVVHGSEDTIVPVGASLPLEALPNVRRVVFPGLRHEIFNEPERDAVLHEVVAWLKEQAAS